MKKNVFGKQLKRDMNERKALFKNLLTSLVMEESIKTTEAKAKAIKGAADKLVTKAKKGGNAPPFCFFMAHGGSYTVAPSLN